MENFKTITNAERVNRLFPKGKVETIFSKSIKPKPFGFGESQLAITQTKTKVKK
jgi:hypothetical protein